MKKKTLSALLIIVCSNLLFAQSQYETDMKQALYIHDTAKSVTAELAALAAFEKLGEKYNDAWLPHYWSAYLLTQIARLKGRLPDFPEDLEPNDLLVKSQRYLDIARERKGEMNDLEKSDFHMLQGFLYSFNEMFAGEDESQVAKFKDLRNAEFKLAIKHNHQNPLIYVLDGISLGAAADASYRDVVSGIALLNYAEEIFNRAPNRALTTYWNKDFIKFWRARMEEQLTKLLQE